MAFDPLTAAFDLGKGLIEKIWPDPTKRSQELRLLEDMRQRGDIAELNAHVSLLQGQMAINAKEAEHKSIFVAGWRPYVGWVCGTSLLYVGLLEPFIRFMAKVVFGYDGDFPVIDTTMTIPVLLGMLGISHHRTEDKKNGNETTKVS